MEETLEIPQSPPQEEVKKQKRRSKKLKDVEQKSRPKRNPNKWQLYIKERCLGKKFTTQKASQDHMRICAAEFRKQNPRVKKEEVMVEN